jgi:hypothetical protein
MGLELLPPKIAIADTDHPAAYIEMKYVDDGVIKLNVSPDFYIDEATIKELTPILLQGFKELMK